MRKGALELLHQRGRSFALGYRRVLALQQVAGVYGCPAAIGHHKVTAAEVEPVPVPVMDLLPFPCASD